MLKISKIFLLLLFLENISGIQTSLEEPEQKAIPIQIGIPVEFYKNHNYFQFNFTSSSRARIHFRFLSYDGDLYLTDPNGQRKMIGYDNYRNGLAEDLYYNGTYYLEVICEFYVYELGGVLYSIIIGGTMDTIDFSKNIYSNIFNIHTYYSKYSDYYYNYYYGNIEYKISNLNENKIVYFFDEEDYHYKEYYYPYYPEDNEPPVRPFSNLTVYEVFDIDDNTSYRNVKVFNFMKEKNYFIRIHPRRYYYSYGSDSFDYQYTQYKFFPITSENIKVIQENVQDFSINGLIIGTIPMEVKKNFYLMTDKFDEILFVRANDSIGFDIEDLKKLHDFSFSYGNIVTAVNKTENIIFMILPQEFKSKTNILIVDTIDTECKDSYLVPANQIRVIMCDEKIKYFGYYNHITTLTSDKKNLKFFFAKPETKATDNIILNYRSLPVIAQKDSKEYTVTRRIYEPRFTFFGAVNPHLFESIYDYGLYYLKANEGINIDNYKNANQAYIRISSKYLPWFEFYNFYFNQFGLKLNLYIKQIYGGSDLYECEVEKDRKDLTFLTTPITNTKCKNKKSIFDRLFTFDGTKILSGYITPDSYFDIYAEIQKENNNNIDIYSFTVNKFKIENSAKYLKKDFEYNLNFYVNHMIRLEPGYDVEITITNKQTTSTLSQKYPFAEILGRGYTIKSTGDAMVYFIGKIPDQLVVQREINLERSKGKIIKLSQLDSDVIIDLGFEGYYPSTFPLEFRRRKNGILYIDNIYEKMKGKLLEGEKLYVYHMRDSNNDMQIEYIENNLNNKNNDYNIFLIPDNNKTNHLVIDTNQRREIINDIHFCKENTSLYMSIYTTNERDEREETYLLTNDNYTLVNLKKLSLFKGDNKLSFFTNQPVIFSYSYYDLIDESIFKNYDVYWEDRKRFYILTINEVKDKDTTTDKVIVKFKPNYRNSSARYIILIARENSKNTLEQFKNPCYVTGLLNQRPKGVKVETIYDVGENYEIEAEVDIEDILQKSNSNSYLISIISQELRFEKELNYYQPLKFEHTRKKPDDGSNDDDDEDEGESDGNNNKDGEKSTAPNSSDDTDDGGLKGASLALAITLPIAGVIIIALIAYIVLKRRDGSLSSGLIEGKN